MLPNLVDFQGPINSWETPYTDKWIRARKLTREMTIHRTPASAASSVEVNT